MMFQRRNDYCALLLLVVVAISLSTCINAAHKNNKEEADNPVRDRRRNHDISGKEKVPISTKDRDAALFEQKPVEEHFDLIRRKLHLQKESSPDTRQNGARRNRKRTKNDVPREDGTRCKFNGDCLSGCCLIGKRNNNRRRCAPKALLGERCEIGEVKGGAYSGYCPCAAGEDLCEFSKNRRKGSVCSA